MARKFSQRVLSIQHSPTVALDNRIKAMIKRGDNVINLTVGEPDFNPPKSVQKAIETLPENSSKYSNTLGLQKLREMIANPLGRRSDEVIVTPGAKEAIFQVILGITNPGDEVIIPIPGWPTYTDQVKFAGGKPVFLNTINSGFNLDISELGKLINSHTVAIVVNSPNNPTGAVYSEKELRAVARLAKRHNLWIISDEVYGKIIYDGTHYSIASFIPERTIIIDSFSKVFAMPGWRIGYAVAPKEVIQVMAKIQSQSSTHTSTISQYAAIAALRADEEFTRKMVTEFKKRRDLLIKRLSQITQKKIPTPAGTFYLFWSISDYLGRHIGGYFFKNSQQLCEALLTLAKVAVVSGNAFGAEGYVRISYAVSKKELEEALNRIEKFLAKLK